MNHDIIEKCLANLEDRTLFTNKSYVINFERLKSVFDDSESVSPEHVQRTLAVLQYCINKDLTNITYALAAVTSLLKIKKLPKLALQDYMPTALGLLHLIKTLCAKQNLHVVTFRSITISLFLSYPVDVVAEIVNRSCSDILEIFNIYRSTDSMSDKMSNEMCHFLHKLLIMLPPEQKLQFAEEGVEIWFGDLIPTLMKGVQQDDKDQYLIYLNCLEILTENLLSVDYRNSQQWQICLKCICQSREYPTVLMKLLKMKNDMWYKIWMIFIKLLKDQITLTIGSWGTPINSMLPTVETAFKLDMKERCHAFRCWEVLADTFSKETSDNCLMKRMKLLLIPLKANNAKFEEIALAKFNCWWHLLSAFAKHLEKFSCEVLLHFVTFAFGKNGPKTTPGVAHLFDSLCRHRCIEAFVNIVGHHSCHCNATLPRLKCTVMTSNVLMNHWAEWCFSLKTIILLSAVDNKSYNLTEKYNPEPVLCAFKNMVLNLTELATNRKQTMFSNLLHILRDCFNHSQKNTDKGQLAELVICLLFSLFDDTRYTDLVACNAVDLVQLLFTFVISEKKYQIIARYSPKQQIEILKPMIKFLVVKPKTVELDYLLDKIISNNSLILWVTMVESILEAELDNIAPETVNKMLLWPVQSISRRIQESKCAGMPWYRLYNHLVHVASKSDEAFMKELMTARKDLKTNYFKLCVALCLLRRKLSNEEDLAELASMSQANDELCIELHDPLFPVLIDTYILMLEKTISQGSIEMARTSLKCTLSVLTLLNNAGITSKENNGYDNILTLLDNLFDTVQKIFQISCFTEVNTDFIKELSINLLTMDKESPLFKFLLAKLKKGTNNNLLQNEIGSTVDLLEGNECNKNVNTNKTAQEFTVPEKNKVAKTLKKAASIVNTVVENGEEYVVVKSNWKFNPRKLTENQKEKLQRKREDIPALYQDLSQSQDEFKLSTWKTDSQDTTTSTNSKSSKSSTLNEVSTTLKNIGSSDVIPTIMENILSENDKKLTQDQNVTKDIINIEQKKPVNIVKSSPKSVKSPRIALKDRVFRNVRNLLENSKAKGDMNEKTEDNDQINHVSTPDTCKTPTTKEKSNKNILNSAPPLIIVDRPSRLRKTPKKFNDVELFSMKKKRYSLDNNCPTKSHENDSSNDNTTSLLNENKNDNVVANKNTENVDLIDKVNSNPNVPEKNDVPDYLPHSQTEVNVFIKPVDDDHLLSGSLKNTDNTQNDNVSSNCKYIVIEDGISVPVTDTEKEDTEKTRDCDINTEDVDIISEPVQTPLKNAIEPTKQNKKTKTPRRKKSRIETELAIDMVEGHPFLQQMQSQRLTRKKLVESDTNKRKRNTEKLNKTKTTPSVTKRLKSKGTAKPASDSQTSMVIHVEETQEKNSSPADGSAYDEPPCSEDVIESSQDSTFTTISVKSTKHTLKNLKVNVVRLNNTPNLIGQTQDLLQDTECEILSQSNKSLMQESKDDIELPLNKTVEAEKNLSELTENMDTEPMSEKSVSEDVIIINDESPPLVSINSENTVGPETQELADADTQPNNPDFIESLLPKNISPQKLYCNSIACTDVNSSVTQEDITQMDTEPINVSLVTENKETESNHNEAQRKRDFLNDTSEISPIKVQSPEREQVPPPQEISSDYVLVKLSAPVESNGEPFDKSASPEFFTEDKISPEKREQSPPRSEITVNNTSPTSALSLKKNRPQVRPGGRAAHMLGLCVPTSLKTIKNVEKPESDDSKRSSTTSTPAKRNLRLLYNAASESTDNGCETEAENFLNFKKTLPSCDSSPSVPILKRKLAEIADDVTASPANKRKRVSFHDPPVSTTVSVQKYIEPGGTRSPSSAHKRVERSLTRSSAKSPKRLEFLKPNSAQLNTALCKAVESFTEEQLLSLTNDTMDVTPAVEIVKTSELNDTDPICPELVDCKDEIEKNATELSSPAMKDLFIKELEGKVATVGDLAKMTELEVNRLCIKAPKIQVAKKVLIDYVNKRQVVKVAEVEVSINETALSKEMDEEMTEPEPRTHCIEIQTDHVSTCDSSMQTKTEIGKVAMSQTDIASVATTSVQTKESGFQSTSDLITTCLSERKDFVVCLSEQLSEESLRKMAKKLSTGAVMDILADDDSKLILNNILDRHSQHVPPKEKSGKELAYINDYLLNKYDDRSLIFFCSQLLQKIHDKPV